MAEISLRIAGTKRIKNALDAAAEVARNPGRVGASVTELLRGYSLDGFRTQSSPSGEPWEPLAQSTLKKRRGSLGAKILQDTGALRASVAAWQPRDLSEPSIGTNVSYGAPLQFGSPSRDLPARPFIPEELSSEQEREIEDVIVDAVMEAFDNG